VELSNRRAFVHVVDDDASFLTAMERRLKHAGYDVATYPSGQDLLDRLPSESVLGCILLDVRIPGMSGPELQARLSELGSTLPIIFLTGHRKRASGGVRRFRSRGGGAAGSIGAFAQPVELLSCAGSCTCTCTCAGSCTCAPHLTSLCAPCAPLVASLLPS